MSADLAWHHPSDPVAALIAALETAAEGLLLASGCEERTLSIVIVDDAEMRQLNHDWRGVDDTTDVLSFPLDEGEGLVGVGPLGDVVISLDVASQQATTHELSTTQEMLYLLTHAFCHLRGHDHHTPTEAADMVAEETRLLSAIAPDMTRPKGYYPAT